MGSPRDGSALLGGLLVCGTCGRRLQPAYPRPTHAYYQCVRYLHEATEQVCFGLKAAVIDDLVRQQVLRALEPAALELSCRVLEDVRRDRARLDKHWKQRLERTRYEAEDAERRYRAVDPDYAQFLIMLSPGRPGPAIAALSSYLAPSAL